MQRRKFFYGWIIVAVAALSDIIAFGAGNASFSIFLRPMTAAFGWSRTAFTGAATVTSATNLFISPIIGPLVDRYGPRLIMAFGAVVACISYLLLGRITELWQFYLLYSAATALGLHELGGLVTTTVVTKWFVRMRGRALAFASLGNNIGAVLLTPLAAFLVGAVGWRGAWPLLGLLVVVVVFPPAVAFMRRRPEDMGLLPDGVPPEQEAAVAERETARKPSAAQEEPQWGVKDALRTRTTWLLIIAFNLWSLAISALIYHIVPYFTDVGFSLEAASLVFALNHFFAIASKLLWGFLAERVPVRYCLMGNFLARALALLILLLGRARERVYVYAVVSGLLGHGFGPLTAQIWADYYGRALVGSIRGMLAPFSLLSNIGGPLFAAFVFDSTGSYESAFWVFTGTVLFATVLLYFARPPGLAPAQRVEALTVDE